MTDSLRYWVDGDARRRLPLRPRPGARARHRRRRRPRRRLLRHRPPGPGALAHQAHRRAVGPRRRRLSGRQLSRPLDRVERPLPRHRAPLLARRPRASSPTSGYRLTGSSDLFGDDGRRPHASINFVTAHDGFTLRDLVSYEKKHNEANGEQQPRRPRRQPQPELRRRGRDDATPASARGARTLARSIMATLFLSQGVPMLEMGDELWRTQRGNNNPYCHDTELSWVDWSLGPDEPEKRAMLEHVRALAALRARSRVFRRNDYLRGQPAAPGRAEGHHVAALRRPGDGGQGLVDARARGDRVSPRGRHDRRDPRRDCRGGSRTWS